jgi:hypothetical protein
MNPRLKLFLELLDATNLPASRFRGALQALKTPFAAGILVRRAKGAGEVIEVGNKVAFRKWIAHAYPGAFGGMTASSPRAANLMMARDTKKGRQGLGHFTVLARAHRLRPDLDENSADGLASLVEATWRWGGVSILLDLPGGKGGSVSGPRLPKGIRVMTMEGPENFRHSEWIDGEADVFLLAGTGGRLRDAFIDWLVDQESIQVTHFGDYDPVGLQEFSKLAARMPGRVSLFVPGDLAERFKLFSNRSLMEAANNRAVSTSLKRGLDPGLDQVLDLMAEYGPMEQESLLVTIDDTSVGDQTSGGGYQSELAVPRSGSLTVEEF